MTVSWTEILGFATGAASVWLYVRQRVSAWPLGIANSAFWLVLFWDSKLYLDSGLQLVYIVLGLAGWYWWINGGERRNDLPVVRTRRSEIAVLVAITVTTTAVLWGVEARFTDSALPFWDASTTVVSLVAQYMLIRKLFGNCWCWIAVDVAYVGMYSYEHLYLTAALQPLFMAMCVAGVRQWRRSMTEQALAPAVEVAPA
jgi:nicotinamide mononucleotide transporter